MERVRGLGRPCARRATLDGRRCLKDLLGGIHPGTGRPLTPEAQGGGMAVALIPKRPREAPAACGDQLAAMAELEAAPTFTVGEADAGLTVLPAPDAPAVREPAEAAAQGPMAKRPRVVTSRHLACAHLLGAAGGEDVDIEAAVGAYEAHEEANQALSGQIRMERLRKRLEARPEWLSKARPSGGT